MLYYVTASRDNLSDVLNGLLPNLVMTASKPVSQLTSDSLNKIKKYFTITSQL